MGVAFVCPVCAQGWLLSTPPWTAAYTTDGGRSWRFMVHYQGVEVRRRCELSDQLVPASAPKAVLA